ncbi:CEP164, partial [Symbiodinium sp. CCMP2456]
MISPTSWLDGLRYGRHLGIDPIAHSDLLWIAVEALKAPLPFDWTVHFDPSGKAFYYHATTGVSSWTHPMEYLFRHTYKNMLNEVVCAGKFCLVFTIQFVAELEIKGTLTGTIDTSAALDFEIEGKVTVNKDGKATSHFKTIGIKHREIFAVGASASASVRVGMGPVFTVWPVPGIPINFNAMMNAEAKALGTIEYNVDPSLLQEDSGKHVSKAQEEKDKQLDDVSDFMNATSNALGLCGAAVLTTFAGAEALVELIAGPEKCVTGTNTISDTVNSAANEASSKLTGLVPDLHLDMTLKSIQLLKPQKLWCKEVYKTPGFDQAPCAATLGCKFAGRPPSQDVEAPPPEQVTNTLSATASAPSCPTVEGSVKMGDRFIQVGSFRLCAADDDHFSVQHESGFTAQIYKSDGTTHCANHRPRRDFGTWHRDVGPAHPSRGISFGFQYIQIGKFRLGAIDDRHLSPSHENGNTIMIFRHDRKRFPGPRSDWGAWDRSEGAPFGVAFGDRFIQIGKFRNGCQDYKHLVLTHTSNTVIQLYRDDGTEHPGVGNHWSFSVNRRGPAPWTCKDISEVAYGACDADWGAFGDRFIQLGDFRLAAIDSTHFSVCHRSGVASMIYRGDGTLHGGPRTDYYSWNRAVGFPHGITFGPGFIQLGNFRLGAIDDGHLSIAHVSGKTSQICRSDEHLVVTHKDGVAMQTFHRNGKRYDLPGHWSTDVNRRYPQWHCGGIQDIMGTCPGLAAGDDFLMLGDWRLAAHDNVHFTICHRAGQTPILYRADNEHFGGPRTGWSSWNSQIAEMKDANHRIRFGDRFIQFGNH